MASGAVVGALLLSGSASVRANVVTYEGQGTQNKRVLVGFKLKGKHCPASRACMNHGKVKSFSPVSYPYPNCSVNLAEGAGEYPKDMAVHKGHFKGPRAKGPFSTDDEIEVKGHFDHQGARARGWFEAWNGKPDTGYCSTGRVHWVAERYSGKAAARDSSRARTNQSQA